MESRVVGPGERNQRVGRSGYQDRSTSPFDKAFGYPVSVTTAPEKAVGPQLRFFSFSLSLPPSLPLYLLHRHSTSRDFFSGFIFSLVTRTMIVTFRRVNSLEVLIDRLTFFKLSLTFGKVRAKEQSGGLCLLLDFSLPTLYNIRHLWKAYLSARPLWWRWLIN
jgi:hypothetical protein